MILAYLKNYPSSLTGAWSSGTGMAGVGGSAFYLILSIAGVSDEWIFTIQVWGNRSHWGQVYVWRMDQPAHPHAACCMREAVGWGPGHRVTHGHGAPTRRQGMGGGERG